MAEHEARIQELSRELGEMQPSRRLTSFLESRAESADYRKHLGLPAMIRRDFEQLQQLMDDMHKRPFSVSAQVVAELRSCLDARDGSPSRPLPQALLGRLHDERLDMPRDAKLVSVGGRFVISDESRDFTISVSDDGTCDVQWNRLRIDRIVLYIDDLDRCPSDRVVEVLQAIRLLLDFELFVVVVGVDARWITQALRRHHALQWAGTHAPAAARAGHAAEPQDFLEKIFQIPLWLEPLEVSGTRRYLTGLTKAVAPAASAPAPEPEGAGSAEPAGSGDDTAARETPAEGDAAAPAATSDDAASAKPGDADTTSPAGGAASAADPADTRQPGEVATQPQTKAADDAQEEAPGDETMNPPGLELDPRETAYMQELARVMGRSPRAVKRFVNVYRLIRAGVHDMTIEEFVGTDDAPGPYRTVQFLLAVIVGTPAVAEDLFAAVRGKEIAKGGLEGLATKRAADGNLSATKRAEWERIRVVLDRSEKDRDGPRGADPADIEPYVTDWLDRVGRYSFRVGRR